MRFLNALRLLALPPGLLLAVARAQAALLRARSETGRRPMGELVRVAEPGDAEHPVHLPDAVVRLEEALAIASRSGLFRPSCLVRSVALDDLMRRQGLSTDGLRVGVRWADGEFRAFAWAEPTGPRAL